MLTGYIERSRGSNLADDHPQQFCHEHFCPMHLSRSGGQKIRASTASCSLQPSIGWLEAGRLTRFGDPDIDIASTGVFGVFHFFDSYWHLHSPSISQLGDDAPWLHSRFVSIGKFAHIIIRSWRAVRQ
jgi:hypothetical protein